MASIEPIAPLDKATGCSTGPQPGTVAFAAYLRDRFGGGRTEIMRGCSVGSPSEHHEGRAIDWYLDASDPADRERAKAFFDWALAVDGENNEAANWRRAGLMNAIWDRQLMGPYRSLKWRPYCASPTGPCLSASGKALSPHTSHVHISLSRAGAAGTTSFYRGKVEPPPPPEPPQPKPVPPGSVPPFVALGVGGLAGYLIMSRLRKR